MSEREWRLFLNDILECTVKVLSYTAELTREEFFADPKTFDAVMRNLEIIGEASKKIPADVRRKFPIVEWKRWQVSETLSFTITLELMTR